MFEVQGETQPKKIIIPIIEVVCPIDPNHRIEPTSETEDTWVCLDCGMDFRVNHEEENVPM